MSVFYVSNLHLSPGRYQIGDFEEKWDKKSNDLWKSCPSSASSQDQLVKGKSPPFLRQVGAAVVGSWPCLASGASLGFITPALPLLRSPMETVVVSEDTLSWVASVLMLGALLGAALSGPLLAHGRRTTLWIVAGPLAFSWAALALAHAPWPLLLTHFLFGVCMGIIGDAVQLYVSEISHPSHRGALGCIPILMFNAGTLACYTASLFLESWRNLAWFGVVLTLPGIILPALIPESPSFLASKQKLDVALAALQRLRGLDWDLNAELDELLRLQPVAATWGGRLAALRAAAKPILLVGMVRVSSRLCGIRAAMAYLQPVLAATASSVSAETATVVAGGLQWVATLAACFLLDRCGRRVLLVASQAVMAAALVGVAAGPGGPWPLAGLGLFVVANAVGLGPVSSLLLGELVAQQHRSVATSATGAASWVAAFLVTKTFFDLERLLGGVQAVLGLYAACCAMGALAAGLWVPETRGASPLQIENLCQQPQQPSQPA
ncbi:facilitated trehalose transporter Tret1-like [Neocloeon triangulifer]|uniref:facilitated trehalose transporter Tret1-like n=1 Tax=Neocloeon triangulifer TaxID=2078957 RepID=UPI00286ED78E|nr:facilitated trehalose transporter Tret1-like [Neocloeon triangulifer]XP_059488167.1 facilitated trehalose transporter Tret1-like [Neocloeon triangulifer]